MSSKQRASAEREYLERIRRDNLRLIDAQKRNLNEGYTNLCASSALMGKVQQSVLEQMSSAERLAYLRDLSRVAKD